MDIIELSTNIEEMQEFEPLPAGPYPAEVRDVEVRYSEKQPNGYFYLVLNIDPNDYPADYDVENAPEGAQIVYARVQVPDAANRRTVKPFKNMLAAFGVKQKGNKFAPDDLIGKHAQVILSVNEYQGNPVNNVEGILPIAQV